MQTCTDDRAKGKTLSLDRWRGQPRSVDSTSVERPKAVKPQPTW
jgi:hypothetical protein